MRQYIVFILITITLIIYPLIGNSMELKEMCFLILLFRFSYLVGNKITGIWGLTDNFLQISNDYISIYLGLFVSLPLLFLSAFTGITAIQVFVLVATVLLEFKNTTEKVYDIKGFYVIACVLFYLVVNINGQFLLDAQLRTPQYISGIDLDASFFITLVSSFRDGNLYANFENGIIPQYQNFSVIFASWISAFTNLTSKVALHGILLELNLLIFGVILIECSRSLSGDKNYKAKWGLLILAFILLQPIHIGKLLTLDIKNFVWGGIGYLSQGMNVGFSTGLTLMIFIIYLTLNIPKYNNKTALYIVLAILNGWLIAVKIPVFVLSSCWIGLISLWYILKYNSYKLSITLIGSILISGVIAVYFYLGQSAAVVSISFDFFTKYFGELFNRPNTNIIVLIAMCILFYIYQIGIRIIIFIPGFEFEDNWPNTLKWFTIPVFFILLGVTAIFNGSVFDENNQYVRSFSSDALQFLRMSSWLITIFAALSIANLFNKTVLLKSTKYIAWLIIVWTGITATCIVYRIVISEKVSIENNVNSQWLDNVRGDLSIIKGNNMIISSNIVYNLMLTSSDAGNFWVSIGPTGYNNSIKYNRFRRKIADQFVNGSIVERKAAFDTLKKNKVDYYVATPSDINQAVKNEQLGLLKRYKPDSFIFRLADKN